MIAKNIYFIISTKLQNYATERQFEKNDI